MQKKKMILALAGLLCLTGCGATQDSGEAPASAPGASPSEVSDESNSAESALTLEDLEQIPMAGTGEWVEAPDGTKWYKNTGTFYDTFDTVTQLIAYTKDEEEFNQLFEIAHEEFERLHRLYDNYETYPGVTNLTTLNTQASEKPVAVEEDLFSLLQFSVEQYDKTLGFVNVAMGAPLALWHDAREAAGEEHDHEKTENKTDDNGASATSEAPIEVPASSELEGELPDAAALEAAGQHMDIHNLVLDTEEHTVFFKDPMLKLDAGAVAKGYATEIVAKKLMDAGLAHGIISAGGNVKTIGDPVTGKDSWTVGISHPRPEEADIIAKVSVQGTSSMVTSGDYQRYFTVEGKRYHHIIDPRTLMPATPWTSVSVKTQDSGLADVLSTAFFIANREEADQILQNYANVAIDVLWVDQEMHVQSTPGLGQ